MNNLIFDTTVITSKSNSTIIEISKLSNKKYRIQNKLFICDGIKLFQEALMFGARIRYVILNNTSSFSDDVINDIKESIKRGAKILCVDEDVFLKLTSENSPQGIVTVCDFYEKKHCFSTIVEKDDLNKKSVIILEAIRDPGNIGTIFRNAVALGIDKVIISSDCADIYSPKVVRASMGALFKLEISIVDDIASTIDNIKKMQRRVLAAAINDKALILGKDKISREDVVVLGNEGHGISAKIIEKCTDTIFIPMRGNTESLNVAMASAIIMWEISK